MSHPFDPLPGSPDSDVATIHAHQTSPLRPSEADLAAHLDLLDLGATPVDALVLGVTPQLFELPWPSGSTVRAVDRSRAMVDHIWPGPPTTARVGDWSNLPVAPASVDRVVSDGGMAFLDPSTLPSVRDEVARVLRPTGSVVFRLYVWDTSQRLDEILAEVDRGTVETVNELRLRSWSALQNSLHEGVVVADAFHTVVERANGLRALRDRSGLPPDQFIPFTASAASAGRYTMWPLDQFTDIWCATGSFEPSGVHIPRCRLGTLSPVLRFERTTSLDST